MSGSSNTLANNTASNNKYEGILLYGSSSSSNILQNNTASNNDYGIYLYHSTSNTLANNTASNNDDGGIRLSFASGNILQNNIAKLNKKYGIHLFDSNSNTLANNIASNNGYDGIYLDCVFYLVISYNTLENNIVNSNNRYGVHLDGEVDNNNITCNLVQNNMQRGFYLWCGCTNNNISYNNIIGNGNYNATGSGYEWQLYNGQSDDVNVANNWWGTNNEDQIIASIYDWNDNPKRGNATYLPILEQPAPCAPTPQIAAGSRPSDSRWDVSGDKRITSLDALMILQAAAGNIEIG
jgi:parallel beta-helix repeat protein